MIHGYMLYTFGRVAMPRSLDVANLQTTQFHSTGHLYMIMRRVNRQTNSPPRHSSGGRSTLAETPTRAR